MCTAVIELTVLSADPLLWGHHCCGFGILPAFQQSSLLLSAAQQGINIRKTDPAYSHKQYNSIQKSTKTMYATNLILQYLPYANVVFGALTSKFRLQIVNEK